MFNAITGFLIIIISIIIVIIIIGSFFIFDVKNIRNFVQRLQ